MKCGLYFIKPSFYTREIIIKLTYCMTFYITLALSKQHLCIITNDHVDMLPCWFYKTRTILHELRLRIKVNMTLLRHFAESLNKVFYVRHHSLFTISSCDIYICPLHPKSWLNLASIFFLALDFAKLPIVSVLQPRLVLRT